MLGGGAHSGAPGRQLCHSRFRFHGLGDMENQLASESLHLFRGDLFASRLFLFHKGLLAELSTITKPAKERSSRTRRRLACRHPPCPRRILPLINGVAIDVAFIAKIDSPRFCERLFAVLPDVMFCLKDTNRCYRALNQAFVERTGLKDARRLIGLVPLATRRCGNVP